VASAPPPPDIDADLARGSGCPTGTTACDSVRKGVDRV